MVIWYILWSFLYAVSRKSGNPDAAYVGTNFYRMYADAPTVFDLTAPITGANPMIASYNASPVKI
jgi:hypothetical protein